MRKIKNIVNEVSTILLEEFIPLSNAFLEIVLSF